MNNGKELLNTVDMQYVLDKFVVGDAGSERSYLRAKWIEAVMIQVVAARVDAGLSQAELGARIGKPQSSVARTERAADIKLSTLFDHLSATGIAPSGQIPCESLKAQRFGIGNRAPRYTDSIKAQSSKFAAHRTALAAQWKARLDHESSHVPTRTDSPAPRVNDLMAAA
jgi:hypothetical protein